MESATNGQSCVSPKDILFKMYGDWFHFSFYFFKLALTTADAMPLVTSKSLSEDGQIIKNSVCKQVHLPLFLCA